MVSEILSEFEFLNAIHSELPWKNLMSKYLHKYLTEKKISSVEFPVAVGRNQDTMKYDSFVRSNNKKFFEHATKHMVNGKTEGLWMTNPYYMITILSQLMDNDVLNVGDKIELNDANLAHNFTTNETPDIIVTIDAIRDKVIDYSYENDGMRTVKDRHISDILTRFNSFSKL